MRFLPLFLAALVLGAVPARAASPSPTARVDAMLGMFKAGLDQVQRCRTTEDSLRADLGRKKAEYAAEYKGTVPPELQTLLGKKASRLARVQEACVKRYTELGGLYSSARDSFIGLNPKVIDVKKQQAALAQLTQRYRALNRGGKGAGKGAPGAAAASTNATSGDGNDQ